MATPSAPDGRRISRRRMIGGTVAAGTLAASGGFTARWLLSGDDGVQAYGVTYGDDVFVSVSNGSSFTVIVRSRPDGSELERFEDVTASSVLDLESVHFSVDRIGAPVPEPV